MKSFIIDQIFLMIDRSYGRLHRPTPGVPDCCLTAKCASAHKTFHLCFRGEVGVVGGSGGGGGRHVGFDLWICSQRLLMRLLQQSQTS